MAYPKDETRRLMLVTRVLAVAILWCVAFSWKLWLNRRYYPFVPVAGIIPEFPSPWDAIALAAWCGVVAGIIWRPTSNWLVWIAAAGMTVFFLQDQSRLGPSFYQFFLLLLLRSGYSAGSNDGGVNASRVLTGMQFVVAAIYFWGGIHKLTPSFFREAFPWFIEPVTTLLPFLTPAVPPLACGVAITEAAIGVGLLTRTFRRAALSSAMAMHVVIFFCIGPLREHWNNAAWSWSLATAVIAWTLFHDGPPFSVRTLFAPPWRATVRPAAMLVLVGILPLLNAFNCWDSALSFNVYSGNVSRAEIWLSPQGVAALPPSLARHLESRDPAIVLDLDAWSRNEFQANQYPENRIFQAVFQRICSMVPSGTATLYVIDKASWLEPRRVRRYDSPGVSADAPAE